MTDHANAPELLPCPFCGSKAKAQTSFGSWYVACEECGAEGPHKIPDDARGDYEAERNAKIAAWNAAALRRPGGGEVRAWEHKATGILRADSKLKGADFDHGDWTPLYTHPGVPLDRIEAILGRAAEDVDQVGDTVWVLTDADFRELDAITKEQRSNG